MLFLAAALAWQLAWRSVFWHLCCVWDHVAVRARPIIVSSCRLLRTFTDLPELMTLGFHEVYLAVCLGPLARLLWSSCWVEKPALVPLGQLVAQEWYVFWPDVAA